MNLQELRKIIDEYRDKFNLNSKTPWQFNENFLLFKEINNKYPKLFKSCSEFIYLIKNYDNLKNLHIFCYCGKKNNFRGVKYGYCKCCSEKCNVNNKEYIEKRKQTILKKYGVSNPFKNKKIIEKIKQTIKNNINKNGLNGYQQRAIKIAQIKLNNSINNKNYYNNFATKMMLTKLNNVDKNGNNSYQRQIIKSKQTKLKKYGNEDYNNKEKSKQTRLNDIDENGLNSYQRMIVNVKQTCLKKYGVDNYRKSQEFKNYMKSHQDEIQNKIYQTKKKNNSFNKSEGEEKIYKSLLTKFPANDIFRQYKSKLYPFNCDFYIKSLDLYIEYHGNWTHNNKPFKNSIEDIEQLNKWKNKNTKFYDNAIYTWSNLDVRKLEAFKENKLNHCIFYNLEQFNNWFSKLK